MNSPDPTDQGAGGPEFDPRRSAEVRSLLVSTVAATPRPRPARLSRPTFALAATVALLFAGGIGAGAVVAYDRLSGDVVAQNASAPASAESESESESESAGPEGVEGLSAGRPASAASDAAADTDLPAGTGGDLLPILTLNGETGFAYRGDVEAAKLLLLGATADSAQSSTPAGQVPIYRADGTTVLGYVDLASLAP